MSPHQPQFLIISEQRENMVNGVTLPRDAALRQLGHRDIPWIADDYSTPVTTMPRLQLWLLGIAKRTFSQGKDEI